MPKDKMKEFEKKYGKEPLFCRITDNSNWVYWHYRQKGWKAALKWVQNCVIHDTDGPCNYIDLMEMIDKELEE